MRSKDGSTGGKTRKEARVRDRILESGLVLVQVFDARLDHAALQRPRLHEFTVKHNEIQIKIEYSIVALQSALKVQNTDSPLRIHCERSANTSVV